MRVDLISRILFIIYCVEAGAVFFLIPWGAAWDRTVIQIPIDSIRTLTLHPLFRSAVTGFGILHLVWAINDIDFVLSNRRARARGYSQSTGG